MSTWLLFARINMKVCWKYTPAMGESGPMPRHVAQVGTLTLLDPNSMSDCLVSREPFKKSL